MSFKAYPSNSAPLCLTSWKNLNKSAKTSEEKCGPPQVRFFLGSNLQMPEGTIARGVVVKLVDLDPQGPVV